MKKYTITLLFLFCLFSLQSQTIFGKWHSTNEETGEIDSVVEVYQKNDKAFAKVVKIMDSKRQDFLCDLCKGKQKNTPILGLNILTGLKKTGDEWSGGKILDPRNGKEYQCYIKLETPNKLKLRGYIGISLLGKTAYWTRVSE
ncbi:MAG: DUF2147 domain-containing protein [Flavobacteriia bacterium]|nr:DUF2147 domain-containing protein [Flavobacteriia bacterium]OIP45057.1 MAG: hypothetical protein AUK46_13060 [Flavobacteriaceae bacterium CG2_30_31_66]PIV95250.1 MAG: DUF2147 domain-containing protein [Flavobacteriaceae bacterium CG17_big_fil_post_rev_8_21_14_2_50_31_13]PIX11647.1 MAG: DUF2147 domain-containing protein [Flavobacteriaceae bacterium CG_4_8_14_3_um_filter_31_8]PIY13581.1 MAG: DUF2147 domain-containing protein [Flavobacteriaceae bacterium CG_4_10_14_3_um_filter_31_253]PIZ11858.